MGPIQQFCTILSNIFKQMVGRQTQLQWKPVKKYIGEIGLERPQNCSITWLNDPYELSRRFDHDLLRNFQEILNKYGFFLPVFCIYSFLRHFFLNFQLHSNYKLLFKIGCKSYVLVVVWFGGRCGLFAGHIVL